MKLTQLAAALAASLLVSACGGGGDSGAAGQSAASAKYVGNWTTPCFESVFAAASAPSVNLMSTTSIAFTRVSDTVLSVVVQPKVYSTQDCSGAAVNLPATAGASSLTVTGAATISGKPVDKVILLNTLRYHQEIQPVPEVASAAARKSCGSRSWRNQARPFCCAASAGPIAGCGRRRCSPASCCSPSAMVPSTRQSPMSVPASPRW